MKFSWTRSTKRELIKYIKDYNKYMKKVDKINKFNFHFKEIENATNFILSRHEKNSRQARKLFHQELIISYSCIVYISYLALAIDQTKESTPICVDWMEGENLGIDPNFIVSSVLVNISNNCLSIIRLIECGLDTSARPLIRVLFELVTILMLITTDKDIMNEYCRGKDQESANKIWYKSFRTKSIFDKLKKLENELDFDEELIATLDKWRQGAFKDFSSNIHNSYYSIVIGAYSFPDNEDDMLQTLLSGRTSRASNKTLDNLNWLLFYTTTLYLPILKKFHNLTPSKDSELWRITVPLSECITKIFLSDKVMEELDDFEGVAKNVT